jgi:squalene synthase HpnC
MAVHSQDTVRAAFAYCEQVARTHYENFPVASLLLPKQQRPYVAAIYAFARTADDFADEGTVSAEERLARLDDWERRLEASYRGDADDPVFIALAETIARTGIPKPPLSALLNAFRMDVTTKRFATFQELLYYCQYSANPVGQLVLHLFNQARPEAVALSDSICTGLQLANFWQDVGVDWEKGRLYLPLEDLRHFGYTEGQIAEGFLDDRFRALMKFQVERARNYLLAGASLPGMVGLRLRCELALTLRGGLGILRRIEAAGYDVLHQRPALLTADKARIVLDAIFGRAP